MYLFHLPRKADLRELRVIQKLENKQHQDLAYKAEYAREAQERKFDTEMQVCMLQPPLWMVIVKFFGFFERMLMLLRPVIVRMLSTVFKTL